MGFQEEVLKQVRETELFKHVTRWLISEISVCKDVSFLGYNNTLPKIAASVCCQEAKLLTGNCTSSDGNGFGNADVNFLMSDGEKPVTVVSGTVVADGTEQGLYMLVPLSRSESSGLCSFDQNGCSRMHPSTGDVLSVLIFALPQHAWSSITEEKLQAEINCLVSIDNLPLLLQEEVIFLVYYDFQYYFQLIVVPTIFY